ncbi:hypothetical protein EJ07DRAFT_182959 [Lizonia empirigonia]|nr:hypothetical protein EJ07DRAFT_182959 [Lizonia empirigonia]
MAKQVPYGWIDPGPIKLDLSDLSDSSDLSDVTIEDSSLYADLLSAATDAGHGNANLDVPQVSVDDTSLSRETLTTEEGRLMITRIQHLERDVASQAGKILALEQENEHLDSILMTVTECCNVVQRRLLKNKLKGRNKLIKKGKDRNNRKGGISKKVRLL